MAVQELQSTNEFRALIDKNELAVVLFYDARAAGKSLFQLLRGGAEQLPHVAFGQGDVNKHPEIYEEYVSRGDPLARHPCLICYRDGHALFSLEMALAHFGSLLLACLGKNRLFVLPDAMMSLF